MSTINFSVVSPSITNDRNTWIASITISAIELLISGDWDDMPIHSRLPSAYRRQIEEARAARARGDAFEISSGLQSWIATWAAEVADRWNTLGPQLQAMGWSLGSPPSGTTPSISDQINIMDIQAKLETARIYADAQIKAAETQAKATVDAADIEARARVEAARIAADAERYAADRRYEAEIETARMYTTTQKEVAELQTRTDKEIAEMQERGRDRRFDLQLAEDQRQFNALLALDLYKLGIELSRNPVDWIAYQYYLGGYGIPTTAQNLMAAASAFGAVPPIGPSSAGPVTGGPATYTGQWDVAAATGAMPGFWTVSGAMAVNPPAAETSSFIYLYSNRGVLDSMLAESRDGLAAETGIPEYSAAASASITASQQDDIGTLIGPGGQPFTNVYNASPAFMSVTSPEWYGDPVIQQLTLPSTQGVLQFYSQQMDPQNPVAPFLQYFSGAVTPVNAPGPNTQSGLVTAMEGLTGQQLQQTARTDLLPGQYGPQGIFQNPLIQSVFAGTQAPVFRTEDPSGWQRFAGLPAFGGMPTGIRSGQDINFNAFSQMLPSQQQMVQGFMEATGQYWKDNVEQMLRSSPGGLSSFDPFAVGSQRLR